MEGGSEKGESLHYSSIDGSSSSLYNHCETCLVSTWFSTYFWIISTPHSVPVYTSEIC